MKVAILAGGQGTRLGELTGKIPKPMIQIGDEPILWHIMKGYRRHGFREFVVALGYKGEFIKNYFLNHHFYSRNLTINLGTGEVTAHEAFAEDIKVHLLDTGLESMTGGRVRRIAEFIGEETFLLTYGDGVADVDVNRVVSFHKRQGRVATVTAVRPPARFGGIVFDGDLVAQFDEKPQIGEGWINGGFFVLEPTVTDYIDHDGSVFEREPMERMALAGQLAAYKHEGFWQCMDTLRDVRLLNRLWEEDRAPWKTWTS